MKTSWKDRIVSALATGALVMGMFPVAALAEAASVLDSTAATADSGYNLVVRGLEEGDTANYYKIIEQDADKTQDVYTVATEYVDGTEYYTQDGENYTQVNVTDAATFAAATVGSLYVKSTSTTIGTQKWKLTSVVDADGDGIVDGTKGDTTFNSRTLPGSDGKMGTADDVTHNGLYVDDMVITSYTENDDKVNSETRQLTPAMVNAIASAVTNNVKNGAAPTGNVTADSDGKVQVANATSGLYMFVAVPKTPGDTDYIYKPVFVAADYYNTISKPEDGTNAIDLTKDENGNIVPGKPYPADYLGNYGVFKRSPLTVDKKSGKLDQDGTTIKDLQSDVAVGDVIDFTITVPIPTFSKNYVAPQFFISDTLTEGLRLIDSSIAVKVKNGDRDVSCIKDTDFKVFTKTEAEADNTENEYYNFTNTLPKDSTFNGFVVQFLNDNPADGTGHQDGFLYTVAGAPTATITYQATVTKTDDQLFAQQVNQMDNTAKLIYSKDPNFIPDGYYKQEPVDPQNPSGPKKDVPDPNFKPDDPTNKVTKDPTQPEKPGTPENTGKLTDKTRHYTFDIDADVLGRDQSVDLQPGTENPLEEYNHDKTSEIRKTWIDADGHVIQSEKASDVKKGGSKADGEDGEEGQFGWLEGAEFTLTQIQRHVTTFNGAANQTGSEKFEDELIPEAERKEIKFDTNHVRATSGDNPKSDAKGYIAMKGLDAGVYVLKEIKAPLGYAFNPNIQYEITITPKYVMEPNTSTEGTTPEDGKGGADDPILESYTVQIKTQKLDDAMNIIGSDEVTTISTYNIKQTNGVPDSILDEDGIQNENTTITAATTTNNESAEIVNKKLGILPATGGSGILFYLFVGGGIAAIALVLMRKTKKAATAA